MSQLAQGSQYSLFRLFSGNLHFSIPEYQRLYSWKEETVRTLFQDLIHTFQNGREGVFLGSIVLLENPDSGFDLVIDGPQRMITLAILFSVCGFLGTESFRRQAAQLLEISLETADGPAVSPRLLVQMPDRPFYDRYIYAMKIDELLSLEKTGLSLSEQKMQESARIFYEELKKWNVQNLEAFWKFLLERCSLVAVRASDQEAAFRIFSKLNQKGMGVRTGDILKAEVIGLMDEKEQPIYSKLWEEMEQKIGVKEFSQFLDQMILFTSRVHNVRTADLARYVFENLIDPARPEKFFKEILIPGFEAYEALQSGSTEKDPEIHDSLKLLGMLSHKDWIAPAAAILLCEKDPGQRELLFKKLERLAICLSLNPAGQTRNSRIERYTQLIRQMEQKEELSALDLTEQEKEEFRNILNGDLYQKSAGRTSRIFLEKLRSIQSEGSVPASTFAVERVVPETVAPDSFWAKDWSEEERRFWANKLANLVVLFRPMSEKARQAGFEEKKKKYFLPERDAGFPMAQEIASLKNWTPAELEERQKKLVHLLQTAWQLEPSSEKHSRSDQDEGFE